MPAAGEGRESTGIPGLDKMLDGGLIPGRSYILAGDPGSGKSTLCGHFMMEGIKNDEEVLYVTIDEPPSDVSSNFNSFGWDPDKITILNAHPKVRDYKIRGSLIEVAAQRSVGALKDMREQDKEKKPDSSGPDLSLPSLQLMLQKEFEHKSYDRLVIDSIISLKLLGARDIEWELGINSLMRLLTEENVTTILVTDNPKRGDAIRPEFFLSRGIIRLHRLMVKGKLYRCIYIEKFRGSGHDLQIRPFSISFRGIEVDSGRSLPGDVLSNLMANYPRP
ncbi:MAG TPA: hypothetical protein ENN25_05015 [Euryarchaeota archaeon]|nr:hypothetical protein [Euryarchaeota archaeon]